MEESRDTAFKLFGKTIPLQVEGEPPLAFGKNGSGDKQKEASPISKDKKEGTPTPAEQGDESEKNEPNICTSPDKSSKSEEQLSEGTADHSATQEKLLKKPDKVLPCPRCRSMETKFCYYNNYSVNQPRHFCKNCQRYWTAGGTTRNLPVGAGRRKNKCSSYSSNTNQKFSHITISDELHTSLEHNSTVLSFGSEASLCTSMGSVFSTVEKTMKKYNRNGFHQIENGEEQASSSLPDALNTEGEANAGNSNRSERFAVQVPYFNGTVPWTYPWSPSITFYPTMTYWGMPWLSPPPLSSNFSCPRMNSPTLGRHSREGNILKHGNSDEGDSPRQENCLWMPKTLRVDDPEEAAKSSIWLSTGFKNDKGDNVTSCGGLLMDFHSKGELKDHSTWASMQILYANPAAHLRSFNFHENA